jgi:16S rRNA (guanine527-N7)-methyltransferase
VSEAIGQLVARGLTELGVILSEVQLEQLDQYAAALTAGAEAFNLTTLTAPVDIAEKHFLDSLSALPAIPAGARTVIDVGTGAGLPGMVLKIARPELEVTLLEATNKKVTWLTGVIDQLALPGITAIAERAETIAHQAVHRARYDVAVARAVSSLAALCELCLPLVRPGGTFIAMKTASAAEAEVPASARALRLLGGRLVEVLPVVHAALPNRVLVVIEQERVAPKDYPRRPGIPAKRPL